MNFFSLFKRKLIYRFKQKISIDNDKINITSLDELLNFYGSDKADFFKVNNTKGHGFSKFYSQHLEHLKNKEIYVLEIGSYAGASAAAFSKYFPKSKIFCLDINISNFKYFSKKIEVFGIDIRNEKENLKVLSNIFSKYNINAFDIIIDDGSHNLSDMLHSLNFFFQYLNKKGTYIIEDYLHPNYYQRNRDINEILMDKFIQNLKNKKLFQSKIITEKDQMYLMKYIQSIYCYKGNLKDSDIAFIKKF